MTLDACPYALPGVRCDLGGAPCLLDGEDAWEDSRQCGGSCEHEFEE